MRKEREMMTGSSDDQQVASAMAPYAQQQPLPQMLGPAIAEKGAESNIFRAILRHAWLVILFGIVGVGGAYLFLQHVQPLYRSSAKIYIEPSTPKVLTDSLGVSQRSSYLYTQCEKIKSTSVLNLAMEMPGMTELRSFRGVPSPVLVLHEVLSAEVGRRDDIITVSIDSPYAEDAATIVNAVVDAYQKYQTSEKRTANSNVLDTLLDGKKKSDAELQEINHRMYAFVTANPGLRLTPMVNADLAAISNALTTAQIESINARANFPAGNPVVIRAAEGRRAVQPLRAGKKEVHGARYTRRAIPADEPAARAEEGFR